QVVLEGNCPLSPLGGRFAGALGDVLRLDEGGVALALRNPHHLDDVRRVDSVAEKTELLLGIRVRALWRPECENDERQTLALDDILPPLLQQRPEINVTDTSGFREQFLGLIDGELRIL